MYEELLDDELSQKTNESKRFAWLSLIFGLAAFIFLLIGFYSSFQVVKVNEDIPIKGFEVLAIMGFMVCPTIGLLMSFISKKKKEITESLWWSGFLVSLLGVLMDIPALYFVWIGFTGQTL